MFQKIIVCYHLAIKVHSSLSQFWSGFVHFHKEYGWFEVYFSFGKKYLMTHFIVFTFWKLLKKVRYFPALLSKILISFIQLLA